MSGKRVLQLSTVHSCGDVRIGKMVRALRTAGYEVTLAARGNLAASEPGCVVIPESFSRPKRILFALTGTTRLARGFDVVHVHDPELLPAALWLLLRGNTVVYDVHEDYRAQISDKEWIVPAIRWAAGWAVRVLERFFQRAGGHVCTATPHIASLFSKPRAVMVRNVPDLTGWPDPLPRLQRTVAVSFVGEVRPVRGAAQLLEAAAVLHARAGIKLTVAGTLAGMTEPEKAAFVLAPGIDYRGRLPYAEAMDLVRRSRVGVVPFQGARNNITGLPTKILEYLAAGTPLVVSDFPVWRMAYQASGAVQFVPARNGTAFAAAVLALLDSQVPDETAQNARHWVEASHTWEQESRRLLAFYRCFYSR